MYVMPALEGSGAEGNTPAHVSEQSAANSGGKKRMSKAARKKLKNISGNGTTNDMKKDVVKKEVAADLVVYPECLDIPPLLVYGVSEDHATLLTSEEFRESCCFAANC